MVKRNDRWPFDLEARPSRHCTAENFWSWCFISTYYLGWQSESYKVWFERKNDLNHIFRSHSKDVKRTRLFAESSGVVSAVLKQIPNQPTKFVDAHPRESDLYGNGGRYEDGILAKSWRMFIDSFNSGNPDYELLVWIFIDIEKSMFIFFNVNNN